MTGDGRGKIGYLEVLAAEGAGTDEEVLGVVEALLEGVAEDLNLRGVAGACRVNPQLFSRQWSIQRRGTLKKVHVERLAKRGELS